MPVFYVNVYRITRHFGDLAEGGWWYNAGQPAEPIEMRAMQRTFAEEDQAVEYATAIDALLEVRYNKPRGSEADINCSIGLYRFETLIEEHPAKPWPETRPTYE